MRTARQLPSGLALSFTFALALPLTLGLSGCGQPAGADLFPLSQGHHWAYDVKTEWENNLVEHETYEFSSHGSERLEEGGRAFRRHSASGVDYWLRADDTGIYRVASKTDLDAEPKPDAKPRYVLKFPLAVGTNWQSSTTAYLLKRNQEFPPEIKHSHPNIPMNYVIEALGEKVATRAGEFSGCVRVKGSATVKLFADPVVGWKDMPLTTLEWYCPGVGLVKLERREPANSTFLAGGTLTMELTQWD
jgi:hypothetical protein